MAFTTPYDSSPPSTPAKHRGLGSSLSTTPAVPLPSSAASFTPLGPPPSTVFGSSQLGSERASNFSESRFDQSFNSQPDDLLSFSAASSNFPAPRTRNAPFSSFLSQQSEASPISNQFRPVFGRDQRRPGTSRLDRISEPVSYREEENGLENGQDDLGWSFNTEGPPFENSMLASTNSQPLRQSRKSAIYSNPKNAKRAKLDESWAQSQQQNKSRDLKQKKNSKLPSLAREFATRASTASVDEPGGLLLDTEDVIGRMYDQVRDYNSDDVVLQSRLSEISEELTNVWTSYSASGSIQNNGEIGPSESAPGITKATFLSTLLVQLHHPPLIGPNENSESMSPGPRGPFRSLVVREQPRSESSIPKVLFDWLSRHHDPESARLDLLRNVQPNPTASPTFWNVILGAVLRAKFSTVIELLENADFNYARTALEDGYDQAGYHGTQLQNIQHCVNKALQLLRSSPGIQYNDWDIKDVEWAMFRKQLLSAITELENLAEGPDNNQSVGSDTFTAPHFGISGQQPNFMSFSHSARMADSRIPWSIYQNIKAMYGIMVGNVDAILDTSEDWVEATIALTAWWDGDDDNEITLESKLPGRVPTKPPNFNAPRSVDANPGEAYLRWLDYAFSSVTDTLGQDGFQINPMNPCEVGLASIFEGNIESVFRIIQIWSPSIAAATAEIASFGGWFSTSAGSEPMHGFNESDLLVLSYGQKEKPLQKDDILVDYASGVFNRGRLEGQSGGRDGWELSLEILSRLDNQETMKTKVRELIDRVDLNSSDQMDKVVVLCAELGFREEALKVSERYGDQIAQNSEAYGMALICYGRAHCSQKIKNVIDLLISFCLIQSRAYPAKCDLDEQLKSLLYDSTTSLSAIASVDSEGAEMLQFYFSSYATLRFYYDIRDEEIYLKPGEQPKYRPLARKKEAADCLVAVIRSAADSIYGGLYDQDRKSATQVDGLLVLLGEALTILEPDPNHFLSMDQQLTILAAIEDLQTVTTRVYDQCEECLQSSLHHRLHFNDSNTSNSSFSSIASPSKSSFPTSPQKLLKKSISATTEMSAFSLIGSEMLESSQSGRPRRMGGSGVLVPRPANGGKGKDQGVEISRGWDWREKFPEGVKGGDILKRLRLLLARGLAFGALGGI